MNMYRLLLHLYPSSFRAEYGNEMSAIFALELDRRTGPAAKCWLWLSTFAEVLFNAVMVHSAIVRRDLHYSTRQIIHNADPEKPISDVRTMAEVIAGETESRTIQMRVLMVFTGVAILLAGLGIYGLLAFTVSLRQQEFGIRMALGACAGRYFHHGAKTRRLPGGDRPAARSGAGVSCGKIARELAGRGPTSRCTHLLGCGCLVSHHHADGYTGSGVACSPG
jgi:hypothetical protein